MIFVVTFSPSEHAADFHGLSVDDAAYREGTKFGPTWRGVTVDMDAGPKADSDVEDLLRTSPSPMIVSKHLKALFEAAAPDAEYLPVTLRDRKKKKLDAETYYAVNVTLHNDVVDAERSQVGRHSSVKDMIVTVSRLVLREAAIPATSLFRAFGVDRLVFAKQPLVDEVRAAKMTGIGFLPLEELKGTASSTPVVPKLMGGG